MHTGKHWNCYQLERDSKKSSLLFAYLIACCFNLLSISLAFLPGPLLFSSQSPTASMRESPRVMAFPFPVLVPSSLNQFSQSAIQKNQGSGSVFIWYGSGSSDLIESGSNPDPDPDPKPWKIYVHVENEEPKGTPKHEIFGSGVFTQIRPVWKTWELGQKSLSTLV